MTFSKVIATFFGIGYIGKGAGTAAALWVCMLLYLGRGLLPGVPFLLPLSCLVIFAVGVYVSGLVEGSWGKDSSRVVIDEVLGMCVTLLFLPVNPLTLICGFILFRFFDIVKPLGIRKLEALRGGWGVMADDLLAGIYANCVVRLFLLVMVNYYEGIY